ncbi:hypothetical protein BA895_21155 [Humibacillus sp. DSM 29435]|nr:hypothetical protein BA895_21155 [Humibacillus sp. DSM 29435]
MADDEAVATADHDVAREQLAHRRHERRLVEGGGVLQRLEVDVAATNRGPFARPGMRAPTVVRRAAAVQSGKVRRVSVGGAREAASRMEGEVTGRAQTTVGE